jgi:hypothetical protein
MIENGIEATARGVVERIKDGATKTGTFVFEVSLDCSRMYKGKKQHAYVTAKFFGDAARTAQSQIKQGQTVRVVGAPGARAYQNRNGETKSVLEITSYRGFEVIIPTLAPDTPESYTSDYEDDIPM